MTQVSIEQAMELATRALRQGHAAAARELCMQILRALPNHASALHLLAVIELEAGEQTAAEHHFRAAIAADPGGAECHNNLGVLLWRSGRSDAASDELRAAIRLNPSYAEAMGNLAGAQGERGFLTESIELSQQAAALRPSSGTLNNLATALMRSGRVDEYVAIAQRLAKSELKLRKLRAGMRKRLVASPLLDASAMARRIESAYRRMWRDWCAARQ